MAIFLAALAAQAQKVKEGLLEGTCKHAGAEEERMVKGFGIQLGVEGLVRVQALPITWTPKYVESWPLWVYLWV